MLLNITEHTNYKESAVESRGCMVCSSHFHVSTVTPPAHKRVILQRLSHTPENRIAGIYRPAAHMFVKHIHDQMFQNKRIIGTKCTHSGQSKSKFKKKILYF